MQDEKNQPAELTPSTVEQAKEAFRKSSKVFPTSSGVNWRLRKPDILAVVLGNVLVLPDYVPKDKTEREVFAIDQVRKMLLEPAKRQEFVRSLVTNGVMEPKIAASSGDDGIQYEEIDPVDKLELFNELMTMLGFSGEAQAFFPEGAGDGGASDRPGMPTI